MAWASSRRLPTILALVAGAGALALAAGAIVSPVFVISAGVAAYFVVRETTKKLQKA